MGTTGDSYRGPNGPRILSSRTPPIPPFYLEALGIGHAPSAVYIGAWGFSRAQTNQVEMTIDYIRVFQPRNRYADMEPRYQ